MKVKTHLGIMAIAILVPVLAFSALVLNSLLASEREAELRIIHELSRASVLAADQEMTALFSTVRTLATSRALATGDFATFYKQATETNAGTQANMTLLDPTGQQVFNTILPYGAPIPAPRPDSTQRVQQVLQKGSPQISNLILGAATGKHVISVDIPIQIDDGRRFVITQWIYASRLSQLLPSANVPKSWLIVLYDKDYRIIGRSQNPDAHVGEFAVPSLNKLLSEGQQTEFRTPNRDGVDMYGAIARSTYTGYTVVVGVPVPEIEAAARHAVQVTAFGFVVAIIGAMGAAFFFSRRLVVAIGGIEKSAKLLGQSVVPNSDKSGVAEVDRVSTSLHEAGEMLQQLDLERQTHLTEVEEARAKAEAESKAKDEFLAMLGHELRNPLAAISSGVTILKHEGLSNEQKMRAQEIVERQTQHLSHLVDDLLDAHRVVSGKVTLAKKTLNFEKAVHHCFDSLQARGLTQRHAVNIKTQPAFVEADPVRLEQMVTNLIENAFKYTPEGGKVDVSVYMNEDDAVFEVADTGVGIAPDYISKVFDVFVQGPRENRDKGGLGIGLAVVRSLANQHGATLTVKSPGVGKGSMFSLRFPRAPSASEAHVIPRTKATGAIKPARVLVIEDNHDAREMLCNMLALSGHSVSEAANGRDGIRKAIAEQADIALIDIDLPDMLGYEVASQLRADARTANMRLIAVTGYGQESDSLKALEVGFDHHLKKPVRPEELQFLIC